MKNIYAIKDRVADELSGLSMYLLFVFRTDAQAARYFSDAINDQSSMLNKHPADYELRRLGQLDDNKIINVEDVLVITGDALVSIQQETGDNRPVKLETN